jgi:hypothetical protein
VAVVTKNIAETVLKDGFLKPSDVCTGEYKKYCDQAGIKY